MIIKAIVINITMVRTKESLILITMTVVLIAIMIKTLIMIITLMIIIIKFVTVMKMIMIIKLICGVGPKDNNGDSIDNYKLNNDSLRIRIPSTVFLSSLMTFTSL